jgi:geranylgeranyl reductase family protein
MDVSVSRLGVDFAHELAMNDFDVAIVGAGPAGSATAIALARRGYAVALVDKQHFPREKLCGDFVSPINWPIFRDLRVENRVLAQPHAEVIGFRITSYSGAEAASPFSSNDQPPVIGLGLGRAQLDQLLLERAAELGATVRTGCRIEKLSRSTQGWRFEASAHESWRAKVLIGADGRNSWVARQLGMNTRGATQGRSVGFQLRIKCPVVMKRIEIHLFPGGYAGLIGLGDGTVNLGLAIDKRKLPREGIKKYLLTEGLVENPYLKKILERRESVAELRSAYPVYFPKRRSFADAVLLVGDAARVTEPVTGEGIYFAMRSGMLAAEALDQALGKGDLSADYLRTYQQMCARALRPRVMLNSILRFAIYRPVLVEPLIRLSVNKGRILRALVDTICAPEPAR